MSYRNELNGTDSSGNPLPTAAEILQHAQAAAKDLDCRQTVNTYRVDIYPCTNPGHPDNPATIQTIAIRATDDTDAYRQVQAVMSNRSYTSEAELFRYLRTIPGGQMMA